MRTSVRRALGALALLAVTPHAGADQGRCGGLLVRSNPANPVVELRTGQGSVCIEVLQDQAPLTAANFLAYLRRGDIDGTFFHRAVPGFVLQGGGFRIAPEGDHIEDVPSDAPVPNEPCTLDEAVPGMPGTQRCSERGNVRGTLAMAKLGSDPNSATNQWFINVADNRANLDNQNGGFTVFARVLGNGMRVVDRIMARPHLLNARYTLDMDPAVRLSTFTAVPVTRQPKEPRGGFGCFDVKRLAVLFSDATVSGCSTNSPGFSHEACERGREEQDPTEPSGLAVVSGACGKALKKPEDFVASDGTGPACSTPDRFAWGVAENADAGLAFAVRKGLKIPYALSCAQVQESDARLAERRAAMTARSAPVMVTVQSAQLSPEMVSPAPGGVLEATHLTFTWDPHDTRPQAWRLTLGATPGGTQYGVAEVADPSATALTLSRLPFAGETVHATLSWRVRGKWLEANTRRHVFTAATLADSDGDGVADIDEDALGTLSDNPDSDGDDLDDGAELDRGTNPLVADSDGDHLDDGYEVASGLDPRNPADAARDADGDGFSNLEESEHGTGPNDHDDWPMPQMTTGEDLAGHTQLFQWTYPEALALRRWRVRVGTTAGGRDVLRGQTLPGAAREIQVSGLPTQGGPVYLTLALDRGRGYRNTTTFAFNAASLPQPAVTPGPGSLDGAQAGDEATFVLVANDNDVTQWRVDVAALSTLGRDRVLFSRTLRATDPQVTVTGLPTFGEALSLRLGYRLSGGPMQYRSFEYEAAAPGEPEMVAPDPLDGSADLLAHGNGDGGSVGFSWTPNGQPVRDWRLEVGTSRGGGDLYRSKRLRADVLSVDTGRVFTSSPVFVRLHYRIAGQPDRHVDYQYNPLTGVVRAFYPSAHGLGLIAPVVNDGTDVFSASGRPCRGNEKGGPGACLPAGLMKVMTLPASVTGCAHVTVSDTLGALEWVCRDTVPVEVVSVGLAGALVDLVDTGAPGAPGFRENQVVVQDGGIEVARSEAAAWWATPVAALPEDGMMRDTDTVYVIEDAAPGTDLVMSRAQRSVLVVAPAVTGPITGSGAAGDAVVTVERSPFAVVTGDYAATGESTVVSVVRSPFALVTQATVSGAADDGSGRRVVPGVGVHVAGSDNVALSELAAVSNESAGILVESSTGVWVSASSALFNGRGVVMEKASGGELVDVRAAHNRLDGIVLERSSDNRLEHLVVSNNGTEAPADEGHGIVIGHPGSRRNQLGFAYVFNNADDGLLLDGARDTLVHDLTVFNQGGGGVVLDRAMDTTVLSVASLNNGGAGLALVDRSQRARVEDLVSAHNGVGVLLSGRSRRNRFAGVLKLGGNGVACQVDAGSGDLGDGTCVATGGSEHSLVAGVVAGASIVGKLAEGGDGAGTAAFDDLAGDAEGLEALGTQVTEFSSRGFGREGGAFPDADQRGPCVSGETCRVWDGALRAGDTGDAGGAVLAGVLAAPGATDVVAHKLARSVIFVRHASEVPFDGLGNDDGLCESGEACDLDLNIGAFQGEQGDGVADQSIGFDLEPPSRGKAPRVEDVTLDARTGTTEDVTPP